MHASHICDYIYIFHVCVCVRAYVRACARARARARVCVCVCVCVKIHYAQWLSWYFVYTLNRLSQREPAVTGRWTTEFPLVRVVQRHCYVDCVSHNY